MDTENIFGVLKEYGFVAGLSNFTKGEVKLNNGLSNKEECYIEFDYQDDKYLLNIENSCTSSYRYVVYRARKSGLPNISRGRDSDSWYNKYQVICKGYFDLDLNPDTNSHLDALNDICNGIMKANEWKCLLVDSISNTIRLSELKCVIEFIDCSDGTIAFKAQYGQENVMFKLVINKQITLDPDEAECIIYYGSVDNYMNYSAFKLWTIFPIYHDDIGNLITESEKELLSVIKSVLPKSKGKRFSNVMKYVIKNGEIGFTNKWLNKMDKHYNKTGYYQFENPLLEYYLNIILFGLILKNDDALKSIKSIKARIKFTKFGNRCIIVLKTKNSNNPKIKVSIFPDGSRYDIVDIIIERKCDYGDPYGEGNREGVYDVVKELINVELPYCDNDNEIDWDKFKNENKKHYASLQRLGNIIRKELTTDE